MSSSFPCPYCGQLHRQGARFCPVTGKALPLSEPVPQVSSSGPEAVVGLTGRLASDTTLRDRYMILEKIGQGGMAAVYKAVNIQQPGALCAIKEMSDAALPDPQERQIAIQFFRREAETLSRLDHPNLPKVEDAFTEGGKHYFVMEFVPGASMEKMLAGQSMPFPERQVVDWAMQLCDVLDYLHAQQPQIIFRDLKPSNVMVTPQGRIKLIDFGIVRHFKPGQTRDTVAFGTLGYVSPEALNGQQTDQRSDLYSLCVTLHQLLTLINPTENYGRMPAVRQINPAVSPEMEYILLRGLQESRELRWQSAGELRNELARLTLTASVSSPAPFLQAKPSPDAVKKIVSVEANAIYPNEAEISPAPIPREAPAVTPPVSLQDQASAPVPLARKAARPTTRLLEVAVRLSAPQFALLILGIILLLILATIVLRPILGEIELIQENSLSAVVAMFGVLGYSAFPRRGTAFLCHILLTSALILTIKITSLQYYSFGNILIALVASGVFMEFWVAALPRIKGEQGDEAWRRELFWLVLMGVIGAAIFFAILFFGLLQFSETFENLLFWLASPIFAAIGWFVGDFIKQYSFYRKTGIKPRY